MTDLPQIFLSPHLDDAALSCGGTIHRLSRQGARVIVLTTCAGPPPEPRLSDYALSLHARWGQAPGAAIAGARAMVARRRAEDVLACQVLRAEAIHLGLPDLIYRRRPDGEWAAGSDEDLFAGATAVGRGDAKRLAESLFRATDDVPAQIYGPLGIGGHVDHHLTRMAAEILQRRRDDLPPLLYYEDYPYAASEAARRAILGPSADGASLRDHDPEEWRPVIAPLEPEDLEAKIGAVACFASQISSFWADARAMAQALTAFTSDGEGAPMERFWRRDEGTVSAYSEGGV